MAKSKRPPVSSDLAEILGGITELTPPREDTPTSLRLEDLTPLPHQPRRTFDASSLAELTDSVRAHGVLTPLLVRRMPGAPHQIVAGERRWRAARAAGLPSVPVILRDLDERTAMEVALLDNLQRANLNIIDRTDATLRLISLELGLPERDVPARLHSLRKQPEVPGNKELQAHLEKLFRTIGGSWTSFLSNHLPILRFPDDILDAMRFEGLEYTKAKVLAGVPERARRQELLTAALGGASLSDLKKQVTARATDERTGEHDRVQHVAKALLDRKRYASLDVKRKAQVNKLLLQLERLLEAPPSDE